MERAEYDVYLSYREEGGASSASTTTKGGASSAPTTTKGGADPASHTLARTIFDGLAARGFRVFARPDSASGDDPVNDAIDNTPDFVLLLTPGCLDASDRHDPFVQEIARAIETQRNIVPVSVDRCGLPESPGPGLEPLLRCPPVDYNSDRQAESLALIAHRLSSEASIIERRVLSGWKRLTLVAGLLFVAAMGLALARTLPGMVTRYRASRPLPPMVVYWGGFGQRLVDGKWSEVPVKEGANLAPGDEIRLVFSPSADGYAYVVAEDAKGDVATLFPGRALKEASRVKAGRLYVAPIGGGWWSGEGGTQPSRICIVASYDPIENLESLVDEREDFTPSSRRALLQSTIDGLVDGKHEPDGQRARTRAGRLILRSIEVTPTVTSASTTLDGGAVLTHPLAEERGRLSALVEIRLGAAR